MAHHLYYSSAQGWSWSLEVTMTDALWALAKCEQVRSVGSARSERKGAAAGHVGCVQITAAKDWAHRGRPAHANYRRCNSGANQLQVLL